MVSLIDSIKIILIIQTVYTVLIYIFLNARGGLERFGDIFKNKSIVIHNIVNVLLVFISIAMTFKYNAEDVLYGNFGGLFGAGYTDIYVWVKYYNFAPYLLLAVVAATMFFPFARQIEGRYYQRVRIPGRVGFDGADCYCDTDLCCCAQRCCGAGTEYC